MAVHSSEVVHNGAPIDTVLNNINSQIYAANQGIQQTKTAAEHAEYIGKEYERQNTATQKILKEVLDELRIYKEEFSKLAEHCDELEEEVKKLREEVASSPRIVPPEHWDKEKWNDFQKTVPTWKPVEIDFQHEDGNLFGPYKIMCVAESITGKAMEGDFQQTGHTVLEGKTKNRVINQMNWDTTMHKSDFSNVSEAVAAENANPPTL